MKRIEIGDKYADFKTQQELDSWKLDQIERGNFLASDITYEGDVNYFSVYRSVEYSKLDSMLKEALVEKELGDPTKWNEYIVLRNAIKTKYPKPE